MWMALSESACSPACRSGADCVGTAAGWAGRARWGRAGRSGAPREGGCIRRTRFLQGRACLRRRGRRLSALCSDCRIPVKPARAPAQRAQQTDWPSHLGQWRARRVHDDRERVWTRGQREAAATTTSVGIPVATRWPSIWRALVCLVTASAPRGAGFRGGRGRGMEGAAGLPAPGPALLSPAGTRRSFPSRVRHTRRPFERDLRQPPLDSHFYLRANGWRYIGVTVNLVQMAPQLLAADIRGRGIGKVFGCEIAGSHQHIGWMVAERACQLAAAFRGRQHGVLCAQVATQADLLNARAERICITRELADEIAVPALLIEIQLPELLPQPIAESITPLIVTRVPHTPYYSILPPRIPCLCSRQPAVFMTGRAGALNLESR